MMALLRNLQQLRKQKLPFRFAALYLLLLLLLILILPWLPLAYHPNHLDLQHILQPPFEAHKTTPAHWLGTDVIGRDVFSNLLYGARTGFLIGLPVMLAASFIGISSGLAAGYFGDNTLKISRASLFILAPAILFCCFYYGLYVPLQSINVGLPGNLIPSFGILLVSIPGLFFILRPLLQLLPVLRTKVYFPIDSLVIRLIEITSSIPWLILILILASFLPPSLPLLSVILILTSWTGIARLTRAEMLRIKKLPYIETARSIGIPENHILIKHALPNMLGPLLTSFTFGLASLLTIESTLSFLGIGVPPTVVSWGRMITGLRTDTSAWWLVVFPGAFLVLTVLALQVFSYYLLTFLTKKNSR